MKANIQFVGIPSSETLETKTQEKLDKLFNKYNWLIQASVFYKKENDSHKHGKICEIELSQPGPRLFAKASESNYELSLKEVLLELDKILQKQKRRLKPHL